MNRIDLTNGYFIEIDPMCYTLKRTYKGKKKGEDQVKESVSGYFGSLGQAIEKYLYLNRIEKSPDRVTELREYIEMVEKADKAAVRAILKGLRALGGEDK